MIKNFLYLLTLLSISSCSYFIEFIDNGEYEVLNAEKSQLNIVFSNNIHGETHPCGCRHFPLGGLPQIAGKFHEIKKTGDFLYVDTGDTFFPTSAMPKWLEKSLIFGAENLARAMDKLGLQYFVPGDKDFAAGIEFLSELAGKVDFKFLIANLKDPESIPHIKYAVIEHGPHKIFITGIVKPDTIGAPGKYFSPVYRSLEEVIKKITKEGYKSKDPFHRLVVLSHSGMDDDKELVKKFPYINWVVGSHTQSFTTDPEVVGNTNLVQVLSRNHYLGQITIDFKKSKKNDSFKIHEIRDELAKKISPNPFDDFIIKHKQKMAMIQEQEQKETLKSNTDVEKLKTAASCLKCHDSQGTHWQKTPHSIAYYTLLKVQEQNNLTCIKCHSVGQGDIQGFQKAEDLVVFNKEVKNIPQHRKKYWDQVKEALSPIQSVRSESPKKLKAFSKKWLAIDEKMKVEHNFSNVQCLNCHEKQQDHPFEEDTVEINSKERYDKISTRCLDCHTRDQSPGWYKKDASGFPKSLDELKFVKNYKRFSCPKYVQ